MPAISQFHTRCFEYKKLIFPLHSLEIFPMQIEYLTNIGTFNECSIDEKIGPIPNITNIAFLLGFLINSVCKH